MTAALDPIDRRYVGESLPFAFSLPSIVYGRGASGSLAEHLSAEAMKRPFVITDRNLVDAGVVDRPVEALKATGDPVIHVREPGEPTASEVDSIGEAAAAAAGTAIVAIGGGASMDSSKLVRVLLERGGSIRDHAGDSGLENTPATPLVAIPTTSGTGSESGMGALYIDDDTQEKTPVYSPGMRPDFAVSDPDLTMTVPPATTAATGADALAQAMGPFTGPLRQPITDALSQEAIRLIGAYLPRAVANGSDVEARVALAHASLLSGISMNNTEAMADQFVDEVIGPRYGIPHGIVAGLILPYVVQYNREAAEERTALLAPSLVEHPAEDREERSDQVVERLQRLTGEIGLPTLKDLGVPEGDLQELASLTAGHYAVEMEINPRRITEEGALAMLEALWHEQPPLELKA